MVHTIADRLAPRIPLVGVALLLAIVLGAVAMTRGSPPLNNNHGAATPLASRALMFDDQADGAVAVTDASDGASIAMLAPGDGGFVRGAMRGLVRERRQAGIGAQAPFRLATWPNGGLTLEDTATGRVLDLRAFGNTNANAFERLLPATSIRRPAP